jgi:serine/threonine-protein kinase
MDADRWSRARRLLNDLLDADPDDPSAWLETRCGDEPALRAEVESLFRAYEEGVLSGDDAAGDWMAEENGLGRPGDAPPAQGQQVGAYRLVEEVGVGGMSVVYRAERADAAYERDVAVKLLQRRLHSGDAEQRVRAERQVLASLDHPGIAELLDGGVTEGGRPYLVMELVDGTPITDYAEQKDLGLDARLDLLEQVLEAVEAAHRQLVVHRDLKPSNVLVTETDDGTPQVKLLDFGIAKLLDDSMPVTRPQTETGHHLMTPAYAAPEQVAGGEIATTTDVYQLGVLAYELLAGQRPFDLSGVSMTEVERIIREEEPAPPSDTATTADDPRRWADALRGDLDVIVQTALRKEPGRRYRSVEALRADLQRWRRGEPIEARPATLGYRARKFVGRNRGGVGVAAAFLLLVVGAGTLLVQQRNRAQRNAERARQEAETAEQVSGFLVDLMRSSDPYGPTRRSDSTLRVKTVLDRGERRIDDLSDQPSVQAELRHVIGTTYERLGLFDDARRLLASAAEQRRRIHDGPDSTLAASLQLLGEVNQEMGNVETADSLFREALAMRRTVLGPDHPSVAISLSSLGSMLWYNKGNYAAADSFLHEALRIRKAAFDSARQSLGTSYNNLANLYHRRGQYDQAAHYYRQAIDTYDRLGDENADLPVIQGNFAALLRSMGRFDTAEVVQREALALQRKLVGPNNVDAALWTASLARILMEQGRLAKADSLFDEGLRRLQDYFDPPHPYLAQVAHHIGTLRLRQDRLETAERQFREAQSAMEAVFPPGHPSRAHPLLGLARVRLAQDRPGAAASLGQKGLDLRKEAFGPDNWLTAVATGTLGRSRRMQGRYEAADSLLRAAHEVLREQRPEGDRYRGRVRSARLALYEEWGKPEKRDELRAQATGDRS